MRKIWRVWAKALGDKSGASNREADIIALVRTVVVGVNFITCFFIMAGVVHNWSGGNMFRDFMEGFTIGAVCTIIYLIVTHYIGA